MDQGDDDFRLPAQVPRESVDRCIGSRTLEILQRTAEKAHSLTAAIINIEHLLFVLRGEVKEYRVDTYTKLLTEQGLSPSPSTTQ